MKNLSRRDFIVAAIFGSIGAAIAKSKPVADDKGKAYSSFKDKPYIQEEARNTPVDVKISFSDKPSWFSDMFVTEWRKYGG